MPLAKIRKSLARRGLVGTGLHVVRSAWHRLLEYTPARRRARRIKEAKDRAFDQRYNVETGGIIPLNRLQIASAHQDLGVPYWAIDTDEFAQLMGSVRFRHEDCVFIDFGSGKGRALFLAAEYPFRKIVGVEFSPELHAIAQQNVRSYRNERQRCHAIELVCMDAAAYPLPEEPLALFLYNPFGREVMDQVVANVRRSYQARPRDMVILYANPKEEAAWAEADFVERVAAGDLFVVYRTRRPSGS